MPDSAASFEPGPQADRTARAGAPVVLLVSLIVALAACAPVTGPLVPRTPAATARQAPAAPAPTPAAEPAVAAGWTQEGMASWYGPKFAGRQTANGEIFDPSQLTAAHKTLPFDTRVRVTDLTTGRSVVVRINDRGPFKPGRIIDLSRAAAESIGLVGSGVTDVRVELAGGPGGLRPLRTDPRLGGYDVIVPGLPAGSLLVLRGAGGAEVLVRTVALKPPATPGASGEDVWTSPVLAQRLGTAATVVLD